MPVRTRALDSNATAVGNVGTGEDDLMTHALIASQLGTDGDGFQFECWGTIANNSNAKTVKAYFGSTALVSVALPTSVAASWHIRGAVIRTGSATQEAVATLTVGAATTYPTTTQSNPAETLSNAITFKCTGTATADNDIIQEGMIIQPVAYT